MSEPEEMVSKLRQAIFVETAYLEERPREACSSLAGPSCLAALLGGPRASAASLSDGPGVVPERLLGDLEEDAVFTTAAYHTLEALRQQQAAAANLQAAPLLAGSEGTALLQSARSSAGWGLLHFGGLEPDRRIPLTFSQGLPRGVVATWDGRWVVRDCGSLGVTGPLALAHSMQPRGDPEAPALPPSGNPVASRSQGAAVSAVAELAGSIGYVRFSSPVLVRSLYARWQGQSADAAPAVVGGRQGLETAWTTHLDPNQLGEDGGWMDIAGGALQPVDEIAFVGTLGLEIGALEVVAPTGDLESLEESEEQSVLILAPAPEAEAAEFEQDERPLLTIREEKLNIRAAAPYIVSIQEAIDRNLRIVTKPARGSQSSSYVPGLLTARSSLEAGAQDTTWSTVALANQALFDRQPLANALFPALAALGHRGSTSQAGGSTKALAKRVAHAASAKLPSDLQRELLQQKDAILEALAAWSQSSGWGRRTPLALPQKGSEEALCRYMTAKRAQAKLDLLTAAYLHKRHQEWRRTDLASAILQSEYLW